jgi:hypothetical protein
MKSFLPLLVLKNGVPCNTLSCMADAGRHDEMLRDDYAGKADKSMAKSNLPLSDILLPSPVKVERAPVPLEPRRGSRKGRFATWD